MFVLLIAAPNGMSKQSWIALLFSEYVRGPRANILWDMDAKPHKYFRIKFLFYLDTAKTRPLTVQLFSSSQLRWLALDINHSMFISLIADGHS